MLSKNVKIALAASLATLSGSAFAVDMHIDGFASIYVGQALDKQELSAAHTAPYGYDAKADFQENSKYGIQFRSTVNNKVSATAQFIGKGNDNFQANISWAYVQYKFDEHFTLKAGRQRLPFFLYSDFLDVGYAYNWVTPPYAVYNFHGFDNIDGLNLEYFVNWGSWTSRMNFLAGRSKTDVSYGSQIVQFDDDESGSFTWNLSYDWFTMQTIYSHSRVSVDSFSALAEGINGVTTQFGAPLTDKQLDLLSLDYDPAEFAGIGVAGDWDKVFAAAEYTRTKIDNSPANEVTNAWYVMGGMRLTDVLSFNLTASRTENKNNKDTIALLNNTIEPMLNIAYGATANGSFANYSLGQLIAAIDPTYRTGSKTDGYSLTIRYDFDPSAAFKIEYDYYDSEYDLGRGGAPVKLHPSYVRMGVDMVF